MSVRRAWGVGLALSIAGACGEGGFEPVNLPDSGAVVLSEVIGSPGGTVAWVSMPPGAIPGGGTARITTVRAAGSVNVAVVAGGFDPVAVPALPGDTVTLELRDTAGVVTTLTMLVPLRAVPIVVRTDPPKKKKDVPLNLRALVVFSEPMDPATVTAGTLRLLRAGEPVAGSVVLNAAGWQAEFVPDAPLLGSTVYVLEVTTGVADLAGDALAEAVTVDFTTEPEPAVARIAVSPDSAGVMIGTGLPLQARVTDASGDVLSRAVTWRSSDTTVATVDGYGSVRALAAGEVTITATADTASGSAHVSVVPATVLGMATWHSCAVDTGGRLYCWGNDHQSHLGVPADGQCNLWIGGTDPSCVQQATRVPDVPPFTSIVGGELYSCGLTAAGAAYCWGLGSAGNLGDGDTTTHVRMTPSPVAGGQVFTSLTAGRLHVCGVTSAGAAYCWGGNTRGQVGDGTQTARGEPVGVSGNHAFTALSAFGNHTCGVDGDGQGWCWGENATGELGIGRVGGIESAPAAVGGSVRFAAVEPGNAHTCGLTADGTAYCWGDNSWGTVGTIDLGNPVSSPVAVNADLRFLQLEAGEAFTCGLGSADSVAYCWGARHVEFTRYTEVDFTPAATGGRTAFRALRAGAWGVCGLTAGGRIQCWASNLAGETGPFRR